MVKSNLMFGLLVCFASPFFVIGGGCCPVCPKGATKQVRAAGPGEDFGRQPWVTNIEEETRKNKNFRAVRWTGTYLQMTLMSIAVNGEIGKEMHPDVDQFIRVEQGQARVVMGKTSNNMTFSKEIGTEWVIFIPAGYWHNVVNIGSKELKVYSIYSPVQHPKGTIHKTYKEAAHDH